MKTKKKKHWRRINPYPCKRCGKKRYSFKFQRAKDGLCTPCRKLTVAENQPSLFKSNSGDYRPTSEASSSGSGSGFYGAGGVGEQHSSK